MIDMAYIVSHIRKESDADRGRFYAEAYEYNLKNVLFEPLLQSINSFVTLMTDMFESEITLGYNIGYIFLTCILALTALEVTFAVMGSRCIHEQSLLFLHIPVNECVKLQKKALELYDEIAITDGSNTAGNKSDNSTDESFYSSAQVQKSAQRDLDYHDMLNSYNDHDQDYGARREVQSGVLRKYDWIWILCLAVSLIVIMMLIYFIEGTIHFNTLRRVNNFYNETSRLTEVLSIAENFQRYLFFSLLKPQKATFLRGYFLNMAGINLVGSTREKAERYHNRSHYVTAVFYEVNLVSILQPNL